LEAGMNDGATSNGDGGEIGSGFPMSVRGGSCEVNADCTDSEAARRVKNVRCAGLELYCDDGLCTAACQRSCTVVRTDMNPCPATQICAPRFGGAASFCSMVPTRCESEADCPLYLPPVDGGTSSWTCREGTCSYLGYSFPTQ
jgi:hypothetical protein